MDMALDDIIKTTQKPRRGGGRGGRGGRNTRGGGSGGQRRGGFGSQGGKRQGSFGGQGGQRRNFGGGQRSGGFGGQSGQRQLSLKTSGPPKLTITNLYHGVTDSDLAELFSEFGSLKSATIFYNRNGQSLGTAQITYGNRLSAMKAMKQYNGVHLDGRSMRITMEGGVGVTATANRPVSNRLGQGGRGPGGQSRGRTVGSRGGRGGNRGGNSNSKPKTAAQLDAEMDAYLKKQPLSHKSLDSEMNEYLKKKPKTAKDLDAEMDDYQNKRSTN